eukprot:12114233-Alexandrium_andersonii.AAC.1
MASPLMAKTALGSLPEAALAVLGSARCSRAGVLALLGVRERLELPKSANNCPDMQMQLQAGFKLPKAVLAIR